MILTYVNPLIAVGLCHFAAGEVVTLRSIIASFIIVASVLLILTKTPGPAARTNRLIPAAPTATSPCD